MKLGKILTRVGAIMFTSLLGTALLIRPAASQSSRPYVVFVNGWRNCCSWGMNALQNRLINQMNAELRYVPYSNFDNDGRSENTSTDERFLRDGADFINNQLDKNRPLILIGHSFGGDSLLSLAPRINRRIQFLGVIDPTAAGGLREPVTRRGVSANVDYFFNRWEQNALASANVVPFDSRLVNGSISGCRARSCDQQEQSLARREDGSEIRIACESWEVTCKGYNPIPVILGGSNGTKAKRLAHNDMPLDAYLQRQMADRINQVLTASQSVVQEASTGRPVLTLTGNFKGSGTSRAIFFDRGNARTAIEVDGRTWYDSGSRNFIFNQTRGRCVVGNFSGSGRGDIACLYDYGNFDVGVVVFVSNGRVFEESVWWRSGPRNFNPDAVEGSLAVIQGPSGRSNIRFTYRYPENVGSVTLVSSGSKFNVVVER